MGEVVEIETVDAGDGGGLGGVFFDGGAVVGFDLWVEGVAFDGGHHDKGIGDVGVEFEEGEDAFEEVGDAEPVGAEDVFVEALTGEVGIGEDDGIAVSHACEGGEEFGREEG